MFLVNVARILLSLVSIEIGFILSPWGIEVHVRCLWVVLTSRAPLAEMWSRIQCICCAFVAMPVLEFGDYCYTGIFVRVWWRETHTFLYYWQHFTEAAIHFCEQELVIWQANAMARTELKAPQLSGRDLWCVLSMLVLRFSVLVWLIHLVLVLLHYIAGDRGSHVWYDHD